MSWLRALTYLVQPCVNSCCKGSPVILIITAARARKFGRGVPQRSEVPENYTNTGFSIFQFISFRKCARRDVDQPGGGRWYGMATCVTWVGGSDTNGTVMLVFVTDKMQFLRYKTTYVLTRGSCN